VVVGLVVVGLVVVGLVVVGLVVVGLVVGELVSMETTTVSRRETAPKAGISALVNQLALPGGRTSTSSLCVRKANTRAHEIAARKVTRQKEEAALT